MCKYHFNNRIDWWYCELNFFTKKIYYIDRRRQIVFKRRKRKNLFELELIYKIPYDLKEGRLKNSNSYVRINRHALGSFICVKPNYMVSYDLFFIKTIDINSDIAYYKTLT
jgi:hypothetical protein